MTRERYDEKVESEFSIILPKRDNEGNEVSIKKHEKYAKKLSHRFGGVTVYPSVLGCWVDRGKVQCEENIRMVSARDCKGLSDSACNQKISDDDKFIKGLGKEATKDYGQKAILVEDDIIRDISFETGKSRELKPSERRKTDYFEKLI